MGTVNPWPVAIWMWAITQDWDSPRLDVPPRFMLAELRVPGGARLRSAGLFLIDRTGPKHGADELKERLREGLGLLPVPLSGSLELRFSLTTNREDAICWRRRIAVSDAPLPSKEDDER